MQNDFINKFHSQDPILLMLFLIYTEYVFVIWFYQWTHAIICISTMRYNELVYATCNLWNYS
jgi:hypothetical protein